MLLERSTGLYASCRGKNVIIAVPFVNLGALDGGLRLHTVIQKMILRNRLRAVRGHLKDPQIALKSDTALCIAVDQIGLPVLIPEGTGIDQPLTRKDKHRLLPFSQRICASHHEKALVRHSIVNVKIALMITDGRSPHALGMLRNSVILIINVGQRIIYQFPVHQIP